MTGRYVPWCFLLAAVCAAQSLIVEPTEVTLQDEFGGCNLGDGTSPVATVTVKSRSGTITFTATSAADWLKADPQEGEATTAGTVVSLSGILGSLRKGSQQTYLNIRRKGSSEPGVPVFVRADCFPTPTLFFTPGAITLEVETGSAAASAVTLKGDANIIGDNGQVEYSLATQTSSGSGWLSTEPGSGGSVTTSGTSIQVRVNAAGLEAGDYSAIVEAKDKDDNSSASLKLTVSVLPKLVYPSEPLNFEQIGTELPPGRELLISSSSDSIYFNATPTTAVGGEWLLLNANPKTLFSLRTPARINVSIAKNALAPGVYYGAIELKPFNRPAETIPVVLQVGSGLPSISANGVVNAASFAPGLARGSWASIFGLRLAPDTPVEGRQWEARDFVDNKLPTSLDGVSVTIGGAPAAVYFIRYDQINVQIPTGIGVGSDIPIVVTTSEGASQPYPATISDFAPAFFWNQANDTRYVAAQHADYTYVGPPGLFPGANFHPALPGEVILLYGTGFGPTDPPVPSGIIVTQAARISQPVTVRIGGLPAPAGGYLSGAGLYQLNVTVPAGLAAGDHPVVAEVAGQQTQQDVRITIGRP